MKNFFVCETTKFMLIHGGVGKPLPPPLFSLFAVVNFGDILGLELTFSNVHK